MGIIKLRRFLERQKEGEKYYKIKSGYEAMEATKVVMALLKDNGKNFEGTLEF